jgi:hypothetical protein
VGHFVWLGTPSGASDRKHSGGCAVDRGCAACTQAAHTAQNTTPSPNTHTARTRANQHRAGHHPTRRATRGSHSSYAWTCCTRRPRHSHRRSNSGWCQLRQA